MGRSRSRPCSSTIRRGEVQDLLEDVKHNQYTEQAGEGRIRRDDAAVGYGHRTSNKYDDDGNNEVGHSWGRIFKMCTEKNFGRGRVCGLHLLARAWPVQRREQQPVLRLVCRSCRRELGPVKQRWRHPVLCFGMVGAIGGFRPTRPEADHGRRGQRQTTGDEASGGSRTTRLVEDRGHQGHTWFAANATRGVPWPTRQASDCGRRGQRQTTDDDASGGLRRTRYKGKRGRQS
jgi:hypothetical protein